MINKKIVKQYFNKYFKQQYFTEDDHEFKSLVRILNKKDKAVKNIAYEPVLGAVVNKDKYDTIFEALAKVRLMQDGWIGNQVDEIKEVCDTALNKVGSNCP